MGVSPPQPNFDTSSLFVAPCVLLRRQASIHFNQEQAVGKRTPSPPTTSLWQYGSEGESHRRGRRGAPFKKSGGGKIGRHPVLMVDRCFSHLPIERGLFQMGVILRTRWRQTVGSPSEESPTSILHIMLC